MNPDRIRKLRDFGLTEYQARVYLALLDLGVATASQVPSVSRVPRTRIYVTMQQLHEKGLVEIVPETPLKYTPVPFADFLTKLAQEEREKAESLEASLVQLGTEFAIIGGQRAEQGGRFEAVYGRRNARERLLRMYSETEHEALGIGTTKSPGRILKALGAVIAERAKAGVVFRYACPVTPENWKDVVALQKLAEVRDIDVIMPIYMHVIDASEFLMSHPIPDDESFYRGEDIAIWTNDEAIAKAMHAATEKIWSTGREPDLAGVTDRSAKRRG